MDYGLLGQGRTKWRNCRLTPKTPYEFDLKTRIRFLKWFDFIVGTPKCMVKKGASVCQASKLESTL